MRRLIRRQPIPRAARRIPLDRPATLRYAETGEIITSSEGNISIDGAFVATRNVKPPGTIFQFECDLAYTKIEGLVEVVWFREEDQGPNHPAGMGLQFVELSPESRKLIYRLIDSYVKQGGTPDLGQFPGDEATSDLAAPPAGAAEGTAGGDFFLSDETGAGAEAWEVRGSQRVQRRWLLPLLLVLGLAVAFYLAPERFRSLLPFGDEESAPTAPAPVEPTTEPAPTTPPAVAPSVTQESQETDIAIEAESSAEEVEEPRVEPPSEPTAAPPQVAAAAAPDVKAEPETETASPPPPAQIQPSLSRVVALNWRRQESGLLVVIEADGPFTSSSYSTLRMTEGRPREVVRIYGVGEPYRATTLSVGEPEVRRIRSGYHVKPQGNELHFVLDLGGPDVRLTRVEEAGSRLLLYLSR